jgi:hypothetical protein
MPKLFFLFLFFISVDIQPIFAQNQIMQASADYTFFSQKFYGLQNGASASNKSAAKLKFEYDLDKYSSQLVLNYNEDKKYNLDGSFLEYTTGIATYGVGTVNRNWSFSDKTSLILSHNARPIKSIYLKLEDRFKFGWLSSKANWSFEIFNGFTKGSLNNSESMLLGARAVVSPIEDLDFEIVQTSQWGGEGYSSGMSALGTALFMDSNNNSNSNINKMAGFGVSYLIPFNTMPFRIYSQIIGEDEAGNFPSCYAYLAGLEWSNKKITHPTTIGIEIVDTRVKLTSNGNCGTNTFYNNSIYNYTNHGYTMGAEIGTEGHSFEFFAETQISQKLNIKYSTIFATINEQSMYSHSLSTKREAGLINSFGLSWNKNNLVIDINIYNQNFDLNKINIRDGTGIGFTSSIKF